MTAWTAPAAALALWTLTFTLAGVVEWRRSARVMRRADWDQHVSSALWQARPGDHRTPS